MSVDDQRHPDSVELIESDEESLGCHDTGALPFSVFNVHDSDIKCCYEGISYTREHLGPNEARVAFYMAIRVLSIEKG